MAEEGAPKWWPSGLVSPEAYATWKGGPLMTQWGELQTWRYETIFNVNEFQRLLTSGEAWGEWPTHIKSVSVISNEEFGLLLDLNSTHVLCVYPILTGHDVSSLTLHEPYATALADTPMVIPTAGIKNEYGDLCALFSCSPHSLSLQYTPDLHESLKIITKIHSALAGLSTPNTERAWNETLKSVEDELKTSTLWRAPHSSFTLGLPSHHLSAELTISSPDGFLFIPLPRNVSEHLLFKTQRFPSLSHVMNLEWDYVQHTSSLNREEERKLVIQAWKSQVPKEWASRSALSSMKGGAWIWRYHAVVRCLAQARAYGDEAKEATCRAWLEDVSRVQAYLGNLRFVKGFTWVGLAGLVVAGYGHQLGWFSAVGEIAVIASSLLSSILGWWVPLHYQPKPW